MCTRPVRTGVTSDVRGRRRDPEARARKGILHAERQRERIAGLRRQGVLHHDPMSLARGDRPGDPTNETVNGASGCQFVERELVLHARELVGTILEPVRPRHEHLSAPGHGHLFLAVTVDELVVADRVRAQACTDLDDHRTLVTGAILDLLAGRKAIPHQAIRASKWSPTRSEFAIAVSAGLTAPIDGKTLVSTT